MQALEFSANQVSAESNKTDSFTFQNHSNFKACLDEEMQSVALWKMGSNAKKQHTYTKLLAK